MVPSQNPTPPPSQSRPESTSKKLVRTLRAEELARDVEVLAADDNDLLAVEELLGDDAGQAAKQVALAIDHDLFGIPVSSLYLPVSLPPGHAAIASRIRCKSVGPRMQSRIRSNGGFADLVGAVNWGVGKRTTDSNEDIL